MEQAWIFQRLAVTLVRVDFVDPGVEKRDDTRERGVRLELRGVELAAEGSIYASVQLRLLPAVCRIDLLESAPYAVDRMHWHPVMQEGEPGERTFDVTMVDDPLAWLERELSRADVLLTRSGVPSEEQLGADVVALREVVPDIVEAARRGLAWARVEPWPDLEHDHRGLATA